MIAQTTPAAHPPTPPAIQTEPPEAVTRPASKPRRQRDWFDRAWTLLGAVRFGVSLIGLAALGVLVGTLVMQAPGDVQASPELYDAWLASPRAKYGVVVAEIFEWLDLYRVFQSLWFRGLVALLALTIMVNNATRAPAILAAARRPPVKVPARFFDAAPMRATIASPPTDPSATMVEVATLLQKARYRVIHWQDNGQRALFADRNRYGRYGTFANHLGLIMILGAAVLGNVTGWREEAFMVPEGSTRGVGRDTGLSVRNDAFVEEYYPNGTASDFRSEVVILKDGREIQRGTIRVNEPLDVGTVRFHQAFFGPAVAMRVRNSAGDIVYDDRIALGFKYDADGITRAGGNFVIGNRQYAVFVLMPSEALRGPDPLVPAGSVRLEVFAPRQPRPVAVETISQGERREIVGFTFEFVRELQFSGLQVVDNPVVNVIWIGAALMILGSAAVFNFPLRRIWVRIPAVNPAESTIQVASTNPRGVINDREFDDLVVRISKATRGTCVELGHKSSAENGHVKQHDLASMRPPREITADTRA